MILDYMKRRKTAKDAAKLLRETPVRWVSGHWFLDLETEDSINSDETMGTIRRWLREHGVGARNKDCKTGMCAEGALLYALALDPTIPDNAMGNELLSTFQRDAGVVAQGRGWWDEDNDPDVFSIPDLNDSYFNERGQTAIEEWLDEIGETAAEQ